MYYQKVPTKNHILSTRKPCLFTFLKQLPRILGPYCGGRREFRGPNFPTAGAMDAEMQQSVEEGRKYVLQSSVERYAEYGVDFDGIDDPARAQNWKPFKKWMMITVLALMTFIS